MKTSLRKALLLGIAVFVVVAIASIVVVKFVSADAGCILNETVCFGGEDHSRWIGSYIMMDNNGRILQSNHWKNKVDLLLNGEGCIYPRPGTQTTFLAKWKNGWVWKAKTDIFGYQCFKLKK